MSTQAVTPEWGHALAIWDTGRVIRVPAFIFPELKRLGLLIGKRAILSPMILAFYRDRSLDPLIDGIRQVLGPELTGPEWLVCRCRDCHKKASDADQTQEPRGAVSAMVAEQVVAEVRRRRRAA